MSIDGQMLVSASLRLETNMGVKVSVILPTYNRSHSIIAACMSVLTQSFRDLELIIVDDASSEDIEALVLGIADHRLRYIRRATNGGAAAARNTGLAEARGRFIAFHDSDDLWLPDKLQTQLTLIESLPESVGAVTGAKIVYGRDDRFNYGPGKISFAPSPKSRLSLNEDQVAHILAENRVSLQNAVFRANCLPHRDWFDCRAKANEDWKFAISLAQRTKIYETADPVVLAFCSPDSISSNPRKEGIGTIRILKDNKQLLKRYRKQHASILLYMSRLLRKTNKKTLRRRFLMASIKTDPTILLTVADSLLTKCRTFVLRRLGKFRMQPEGN